MSGQGSGGNVLAALVRVFIPGQGRVGIALIQFVLAVILWFVFMGWVIHLWSIIDAARWSPKEKSV